MLCDNIRAARKAAGLSKAEVARRSGLEYTTYDGYETGRRSPKPDVLPQIANALSVDVNFLLYGHVFSDAQKMKDDKDYIPNKELVGLMKELEIWGGMKIQISEGFDNLKPLGKILLWRDVQKYLAVHELLLSAEEKAEIEKAREAYEEAKSAKRVFATLSETSPIAALIPALKQSGYNDEAIQAFIDLLERRDPDALRLLSQQQPDTQPEK